MSRISRQSLTVLFVVLLCLLHPMAAPRTWAQESGGNTTPDLPARKTADIFQEATLHLRSGKRFDRAITLLTEAVRREPENAEYHTVLGTALTARAVSLSRLINAHRQQDAIAYGYQGTLDEWKKAQENKQHPLYGKPQPLPPSPPHLLDDARYDAPDTEIHKQISVLLPDALLHLQKGYDLCAADPEPVSQKNKDLLLLQGWSALLLLSEPCPEERDAKSFQRAWQMMMEQMEKALTLDLSPTEKQSVGDAFIYAHERGNFADSTGKYVGGDKSLLPRGITLLMEAAPKARDRAAIWYWIGIHQESAAPESALESFKNAAKFGSSNGIYAYSYAVRLAEAKSPYKPGDKVSAASLSEADNREILNWITAGNNAPAVSLAGYAPAAPRFLRWAFADNLIDFISFSVKFGILAEAFCNRSSDKKEFSPDMNRLRVFTQAGMQFVKSSESPALSDNDRNSCYFLARNIFSVVGASVYRVQVGQPTKDIADDLKFTPLFLSEKHRKAIDRWYGPKSEQ